MPVPKNVFQNRRFMQGRVVIQPYKFNEGAKKEYLTTQWARGNRFLAPEISAAAELHIPDEQRNVATMRPLDEILGTYGSAGPIAPIAPPRPGPAATLPNATDAEEQGGRIIYQSHKRSQLPKTSFRNKRAKVHGGLFH